MPDKCTEPCADLTRLEKELDKFQGQNSDTHREIFKRLNELERAEAAQEQHFSTVNEKLDKLIEWQGQACQTVGEYCGKSGLGRMRRGHRVSAGEGWIVSFVLYADKDNGAGRMRHE